MTANEIVWLGGVFTAIGALIGALAALLAARFAWQHLHYNEAAAAFRAGFVDTICRLRSGREDVFKIITSAVLVDQEHALIKFEAFLKPSERGSNDRACPKDRHAVLRGFCRSWRNLQSHQRSSRNSSRGQALCRKHLNALNRPGFHGGCLV